MQARDDGRDLDFEVELEGDGGVGIRPDPQLGRNQWKI